MKQYAVNLISTIYNRPVGIIANNVKELKAIIKQINSKLDKTMPKVEYLALPKANFKKETKRDPYEQIELFLEDLRYYTVDTQKALKFYASKED